MSVSGWCMQALKAGKMSKLFIPEKNWRNAMTFMDTCQSGDGYSYCTVGQYFCGDHQCTFVRDDCPTLHGRIRGLTDYPNPNREPTFQEWQLATGQLTADDVE